MSRAAGLAGWVPMLAALCLLQACAGLGPGHLPPADAMEEADRQIIVAVRDQPLHWRPRAGSMARPYHGGGPYRGSPEARRNVSRIAETYGLVQVSSWPIRLLDLYCVVYQLPGERARDEVIQAMAREPGIMLVQPMQEFRTLGERPVSDSPNPVPGSVARLDLELAHRWSLGRGVMVAVIDTGVDGDHPGLAGRLAMDLDFVGARDDPEVAGRHGTAVAGVIAASAHAQLGVLGVAPEARLAILKACWQTSPSEARCNSYTLARAIAAAVELGAGVINLSLTGPPDPLLERLLGEAMARDQVVIGAMPPGPAPRGLHHFPTSVSGVIRVQMAELEGAGSPGALLAPGEDVLTLQPGARYGRASGSSLAAAHVSGIVALLLEREARLDAAQVRALLETHTRPLELRDRRRVMVVSACDSVASLVDSRCTWPADSAGSFAAPPRTSAASVSRRPSQ
jgi:hypothetical protein